MDREKKQRRMNKKKPKRINHDEALKKLLHTFFKEFIELFFPELATELDLEEVQFLPEEQIHDIVGKRSRRLDVLFRTRLRGQEVRLLVHMEPQSWHEVDFHERMFIYFGRLFEKYRKENKLIIPIAVFTGERKTEVQNEITMDIAGHALLRFRFLKVQLSRRHWRQFIDSDNPVAAALLAKMDYNKEEKRELRKQYLRMLLRMRRKLDDARLALVMSIADLYYEPSAEEDQSIVEELIAKESEEGHKLMKLMPAWKRWGYEEGMEKGIEQGMEKGKEQGREQMLEKTVRKLHGKGFSLDQISDVVDEPIERIGKWLQ